MTLPFITHPYFFNVKEIIKPLSPQSHKERKEKKEKRGSGRNGERKKGF